MFREQSPINNTVFLSFYTDMEARLHFESNFSGTLFSITNNIFRANVVFVEIKIKINRA